MKWLFLLIALLAMSAVAYAQVGGMLNPPINATGVGQIPGWQPMYVPQGGTYVPPVPAFILLNTASGKILLNGGGATLCNAC